MILLILLLLTIVFTLYYNFAPKTGRSVWDYAASIDSLIFLGDYSGAVAECSDGLRYYPDSAELYIQKARAYMLMGDSTKAVGTLDYGYKQTKSEDILRQREQIVEAVPDNIGFVPLTESDAPSEDPDNSSAVTGASGGETSREPYLPDTQIRITIPNVTPPPAPPIENVEESSFESEISSDEN